MADIVDSLTLSFIPGVGPVMFWRLVRHFGSPGDAIHASCKELKSVSGISTKNIEGFGKLDLYRQQAMKELRALEERGARAVNFTDPHYPELLRRISDPPPVLFVQGTLEILNRPAVAIVGSRAATSYGCRVSRSLAGALADNEFVVVSGLALGVDREAHVGALAVKGKTVAVLGCGLDIIYPRQNSSLFGDIGKHGALVTEYPLGTRPEGFRFPARNRIISGLSQGVVVVEAARKSGSLITAQLALDEGREVFAVPGQVNSSKSRGAHWLLQQGAKLVESADDIMEELYPLQAIEKGEKGRKESGKIKKLDPDAQLLLQYLDSYPCSRDHLVERMEMPVARVSELLLLLELEGIIEMLPGNQICRVDSVPGSSTQSSEK